MPVLPWDYLRPPVLGQKLEAGGGTGAGGGWGACLIARQNLVHPCGSCSVQDGRTHPSGHTFTDRLTTKQTCGVPTSKVFTPWIRVPQAYMALEGPQLRVQLRDSVGQALRDRS